MSKQTDRDEDRIRRIARRRVLQLGGAITVGLGSSGAAAARGPPNDQERGPPDDDERGPPDDERGPPDDNPGGPPEEDPDERRIEWKGQGDEHATQDCPDAAAYWQWILTPGGSTEFQDVGELVVRFEDGSEQTVPGSQRGRGAYQFHIRELGGGTVDSAFIDVMGGGSNALLTISDGGCEDAELAYWQVDFGEGDVRVPPRYWPDDVMAALGNTEEGVTDNPSHSRQQTDGQLGDVSIDNNRFSFDDEGSPTEVTVSFTVDEDGEGRTLHLSSFVLPGEFDEDDVDEQELFDSVEEEFDGGDSGELTIDLPTG